MQFLCFFPSMKTRVIAAAGFALSYSHPAPRVRPKPATTCRPLGIFVWNLDRTSKEHDKGLWFASFRTAIFLGSHSDWLGALPAVSPERPHATPSPGNVFCLYTANAGGNLFPVLQCGHRALTPIPGSPFPSPTAFLNRPAPTPQQPVPLRSGVIPNNQVDEFLISAAS